MIQGLPDFVALSKVAPLSYLFYCTILYSVYDRFMAASAYKEVSFGQGMLRTSTSTLHEMPAFGHTLNALFMRVLWRTYECFPANAEFNTSSSTSSSSSISKEKNSLSTSFRIFSSIGHLLCVAVQPPSSTAARRREKKLLCHCKDDSKYLDQAISGNNINVEWREKIPPAKMSKKIQNYAYAQESKGRDISSFI